MLPHNTNSTITKHNNLLLYALCINGLNSFIFRLKFCDKSKCCTTKVLSHTFSSEWVKNKKETWDGSDLGNCTQILFDENLSSIELALLKDGKKTGPEVKSITLSAQVGSDKKNIKTYKCGSYKLLASDRIKSNFCQRQSAAKPSSTTARSAAKPTSRPSSPLSSVPSMTFKKIDVQMGGAGSDDDMRVRICDASKCCTTKKLSHTFGSEWVAKKKETWDGSDMGNCSGRSNIILGKSSVWGEKIVGAATIVADSRV